MPHLDSPLLPQLTIGSGTDHSAYILKQVHSEAF